MKEAFESITAEVESIQYRVDDDGVAWLTFDRPGAKVNILNTRVMKRLDELATQLERDAASGRVRSAVLRSGKPGTFIAGADVNEIVAITDPIEGAAKARAGQEVFVRL